MKVKTQKTVEVEVDVELPFYYVQHFDGPYGEYLVGRVTEEETVVIHCNRHGYEIERKKEHLSRSLCYYKRDTLTTKDRFYLEMNRVTAFMEKLGEDHGE